MSHEPTAAILLYHRIHDSALDPWGLCVTPEHFEDHLAVVQERYTPISLRRLVRGIREQKLPPRSVAITFDDGYVDVLHSAVPLLRKRNVPATLFLVSGMIGNDEAFWWDQLESILLRPGRLASRLDLSIGGTVHHWELGEEAECDRRRLESQPEWRAWDATHPTTRHAVFYAIWEVLRRATAEDRALAIGELRAAAGLLEAEVARLGTDRRAIDRTELAGLAALDSIEIGAHSRTHPSLAALDRESQHEEIAGSKRDLERLCQRTVASFSYPFGHAEDYSAETIESVQRAGFVCACANAEGIVRNGSDLFQLPRLNVLDLDGTRFAAHLESAFTDG